MNYKPNMREEGIINMYTSGLRFSDIQRTYNCSRRDIGDVLEKYGIPRRESKKKEPINGCLLPEDVRYCFTGKCLQCGWNPEVHAIRVKAIREGREYGAKK